MKPLPDSVKALIEDKVYAHFATLMPDGSPHVVQTWVDHDGDTILINTNEGSQKHKNAARNAKVALDISDPANPYRVAFVRGQVREITLEGAQNHIDKLARKYLGQDKYPMQPGTKRILIKIDATHVRPPQTEADRQRWRQASSQSQ